MSVPEWLSPLFDVFNAVGNWIQHNQIVIIYSVITILVGYALQRLVTGQIEKRMENQRLGEHLAHTLLLIIRIITFLAVFSTILVLFQINVTVVTGFLSVVGGTILGFAAINTLGNAIAGFIVILSRPFMVGDRIYFQGKFSDVISIGIIYTKMRTLDLVYVSVPNQELLKSEIQNYGKKRIVRRSVSITAGYEHDIEVIKKVLLEATQKVELVLWAPKPSVAITEFQNYAIEYTLFFFIREVKRMMFIDSQIRDAIYTTCKENNIDLSTPLIISRDPITKKK